ncbi:2-hydroxy-3-oxopropionate reductase [Leishmania donovani]|uniref:2-hydroxy-3-oxopropionate_reductase_-_putative n=3 Tax=Leishmania donovani species complex TaxID=38574 RepID=A0A6L0XVI2_LEIIN|nr:putative 2-hydroxy-3-oxopropionate reductase [Leishmania infantum JPCM5]XP_003862733.1 2-hydroxy-3-oxopropionate reductase, putative [Leishmania donovani]CAC9511565.1 2-hydroxy-3-oxopropionate_reductase_-_putative [Leishmania infantum]AYU80813.1 2-hydroxy-3-oxopropionate reductase, putative [Leishmania donovani]CAJ1990800.1 2-hydroxy-3-oxopropionate reductase [Leishmania donovani]CAM69880.1 putative 2-hydroxy-3-oxopropionate reductase [Leishmania infantum JPCM5]CBZ36040.1 2-hydroxy-3-oxopr|eukprot:XP_001466831.1 putative 2-hydroxy-3-oxopropionate reductase [Leishmania infantum JPCM5]
MRVGYIGLGLMGKPMAVNILKAGFPVSVWNRTASKCDDLVAAGATACATPAELAAASDVVFTNLSDSPDVMEIVFGPNGVAAGIREGAIFVDNSTIKPSVAQEIARRLWKEKKVRALDAPVSGGDIGARNGTLTVMVGGDAAALETVLPVLLAVGKKVTRIGDCGAGQVCKAANQIMVAAQMVALGEILVFSEKCGVSGPTVIEAIKSGSAQCWTLDVKPDRLFAGNREPGFKAALQSKDMGIVMDSAKEFGVPLPSTAVNTQLFQAMIQNGDGDQDNSAVVSVLERMANVHISEVKKE